MTDFQWKRVQVYSLPPFGNEQMPTLESVIEEQNANGWTFIALIPGKDNHVAEYRKPAEALFRAGDLPPATVVVATL